MTDKEYNPFDGVEDNILRLRQAFLEHQIDTQPKGTDRWNEQGKALIANLEERQRRQLGQEAVSHTAQQTPGGAPIDTERWRK